MRPTVPFKGSEQHQHIQYKKKRVALAVVDSGILDEVGTQRDHEDSDRRGKITEVKQQYIPQQEDGQQAIEQHPERQGVLVRF